MDRRLAFNSAMDCFLMPGTRTQQVVSRLLRKNAKRSRDTRLGKNRRPTENQTGKYRADSRWIVGVTTDGIRYE